MCNLTKDLMSVVFPDPRGPHTTITVGATPASRLMVAATSFRWDRSAFLCKERFDRPRFATPKARVLCLPLCWPPARKRSAAFFVDCANPSFRGLWRALDWSAMILCRVDGVQLREATAVRAVPLRRDRAGAMRYQNRAMHDRRAASRVEQWLEATRWSDALSLQCTATQR